MSASSTFPIEICEFVIDAVYDMHLHHPPDFVWESDPEQGPEPLDSYYCLSIRQQTLRACALTCRAWYKRAGVLLWKHVALTHEPSRQFAAFLETMIFVAPDYQSLPVVSSLWMSGECRRDSEYGWSGWPIQPLPHLKYPTAPLSENSTAYKELTSTLDRIRRPLFPTITEVYLRGCTFTTASDFFEFLWSCPQLSHLAMQDCDVHTDDVDSNAIGRTQGFQHKHRAEILTKFTSLHIYDYPLTTNLRTVPGQQFGTAVTSLRIGCISIADIETVPHFVHAFRGLQDLHIAVLRTSSNGYYVDPDLSFDRPFIFELATSVRRLPYPRADLRTLTIRAGYPYDGDLEHSSCSTLFGPEEPRADLSVARDLFPKLSRLEVDIRRGNVDEDRDACFERIASALPSMVDVLRFRDHREVTFAVVDGRLQAVSE